MKDKLKLEDCCLTIEQAKELKELGVDFEITIHDLSHNGVCYIDFNNGEYIVNALSVMTKYQNKGIGTFLIKSAEEFISNLKGNKAILYVEKDTWQEEWYKRLGYHESNIQDGVDGFIRYCKRLPRKI